VPRASRYSTPGVTQQCADLVPGVDACVRVRDLIRSQPLRPEPV